MAIVENGMFGARHNLVISVDNKTKIPPFH